LLKVSFVWSEFQAHDVTTAAYAHPNG